MCLLFSFEAFNIIFSVITFMVLAVFIMVFTTIFRQHHQNSNAPRLTVPATAIGKRMDVSAHHHNYKGNSYRNPSSATFYYITFEVESGDRMELFVHSDLYGLIVEGDRGNLTFQGTDLISFERF